MKAGVSVTFWDWTALYGTWGEPGVYKIIDLLHRAGVRRIYWRMRQSQCLYASKIDRPGVHFASEDNTIEKTTHWGCPRQTWRWINEVVDFSEFDPVPVAIDRCRQLGIEIYAWLENVEAHGWGWDSGFSTEHPELLMHTRAGYQIKRLCWAYPEVIDFKLSLIREILDYGFDGLAHDFFKGGCNKYSPIDRFGVFQGMYDEPVIRAFREKTGKDPFEIPNDDQEWLQFRADYITAYLRKVCSLIRASYPDVVFEVLLSLPGSHVWATHDGERVATTEEIAAGAAKHINIPDPFSGNIEDQDAWIDEGLADSFTPVFHFHSFDDVEGLSGKARAIGRKLRGNVALGGFFVVASRNVAPMERAYEIAEKAEMEHVMLFGSRGFEIPQKLDVLRELCNGSA